MDILLWLLSFVGVIASISTYKATYVTLSIPGTGASGANGAPPCTGFTDGNLYVGEPEINDMKTVRSIYQWATAGFTGEFKMRDRPHGKGRLTCSNGDIYDGEWKAGLFHGKVKLTHSNGDIMYEYDGELKYGKPHGKGKITYASGAIYEGDFEHGQPHGKGKVRAS
eukprot:CAMPEP_0201738804 /NCGR_PEP_ID=MMETSP0593-20130828/45445_1 /ASSEMBLY_ACC=CAM_ASM_000672 /TAXON_ID=267983 /ORGANISM="Skeletonema japonicum, Strain CCMP2506" /LENGTH=166 /DNA_ID=CAMNT_0048233035 /DNA_START=75 /DNA_END=575 /DNA_ORIENTATION=+